MGSTPPPPQEEASSSAAADTSQNVNIIESEAHQEDAIQTANDAIPIERTRHNFSYTANELRQRSVAKESIKHETPTKTTAADTFSTNFKDDFNHNGGGFYECNIWYI